jgi:hypothetical protein
MNMNHLSPDDDLPALDPLAADRDAPWLGVRVVSEMIFCPRAGLIAFELNKREKLDDDEDGKTEKSPRLDWRPEYNDDILYEALQQKWDEVYWVLKIAIWWAIVTAVVLFAVDFGLGGLLAVPLAVIPYWFIRQGQEIWKLERRWRAYRHAQNTLQISELGGEERTVNWWQLRKAGFVASKPQEPHVHREWRLAGRPFLVLSYQALRIPVFRKHRGQREVHSQNRARIAAYCQLLEWCERAQSPFGIMLFADSYEAVISPNNARSQAIFREGLLQARAVIIAAEAGDPPGPPTRNQCKGCFWGYPKVFRSGTTDRHLADLPGAFTPRKGVDGKYHSVCGDRFEWLPPHQRVEEKKIDRS